MISSQPNQTCFMSLMINLGLFAASSALKQVMNLVTLLVSRKQFLHLLVRDDSKIQQQTLC